MTGITPALSAGARATVRATMERARSMGVPTTLDVNYRPALWGPDEARPVLEDLAGLAAHVFVGEDEAEAVGWGADAEAIAARLAALGAGLVIVKQAERGATAIGYGRSVARPRRAHPARRPPRRRRRVRRRLHRRAPCGGRRSPIGWRRAPPAPDASSRGRATGRACRPGPS